MSDKCTGGTDRDPLDMTLREVAAACGDGSFSEDVYLEDLPDGRPPMGNVSAAFEEIHPAAAGALIRRIAEGLDEGYTAQGSAHPHFQRPLRQEASEQPKMGTDREEDN